MAKPNYDIKKLSVADIQAKVAETQANLQQIRFSHIIEALPNTHVMGSLRKEIARLKTELRTREIAAAKK